MKIIRLARTHIQNVEKLEGGDDFDDNFDNEEDDGRDLYEDLDSADKVFQEVKIRTSLRSQYQHIALVNEEITPDSKDIVAGGIQGSWDENEDLHTVDFSWDVAVKPEFQGKGIGKQLINAVIKTYYDNKDMKVEEENMRSDLEEDQGYQARMYVTVINSNLASYLETIGFQVDSEYPDRKFMVKY